MRQKEPSAKDTHKQAKKVATQRRRKQKEYETHTKETKGSS